MIHSNVLVFIYSALHCQTAVYISKLLHLTFPIGHLGPLTRAYWSCPALICKQKVMVVKWI